MKNKILCILTAIGLLSSGITSGFAERIAYRELPDAVRKMVQKDRSDIKKIETFSREGKTVYEVQIDKKDGDKFIYLAEDGTRLNDHSLRNERKATLGTLKLADLPKPVQQTFRQQAGSVKVSKVNADVVAGKTTYGIEYIRAGQSDELWINEDGSIRSDYSRLDNRDLKQSAPVGSFDRPLAATQKIDFNSAPEAVKRTAREIAGSNRIEDTERGKLDGRTVYEIAFKENGVHNELRVAEDGSIVQRIVAGGVPVSERKDLGNMTIDQVPDPVRRTIREQVGSGEINDIDKLSLGGRIVYEVGFKKESGGAQHEIQIAEDGAFLGEAAGAKK